MGSLPELAERVRPQRAARTSSEPHRNPSDPHRTRAQPQLPVATICKKEWLWKKPASMPRPPLNRKDSGCSSVGATSVRRLINRQPPGIPPLVVKRFMLLCVWSGVCAAAILPFTAFAGAEGGAMPLAAMHLTAAVIAPFSPLVLRKVGSRIIVSLSHLLVCILLSAHAVPTPLWALWTLYCLCGVTLSPASLALTAAANATAHHHHDEHTRKENENPKMVIALQLHRKLKFWLTRKSKEERLGRNKMCKLIIWRKFLAGFMNVNKTGKWNTFFWFFPVEGQPLETTPWIIWLQGGPGVSSLYGLFEEIGPIRVVNGEAEKREIHWGSDYSLLFIDNPVGTGFSFQEDFGNPEIYNEDQVGECLLNFIQQFLDVFPELRKAPLFITGESYAGKYIPAFGHYIHNKQDDKPINFKGVAIGDGYTDPPSLLHYAEFGLGHGFLDPEQAAKVAKLEAEARKYWDEGNIEMYENKIDASEAEFKSHATLFVYNFMEDGETSLEYPEFVIRPDVKKAIHVGNVRYIDRDYNSGLWGELRLSVKPWLEELLDKNYGVMCYNGELDVIIAYGLSIYTYRSLQWSGQQNYLNADRNEIMLDTNGRSGHVIGYLKEYENFMDVMVRRAGHMVPKDQPEAAKYFLDMFINKFKD